ncbi:MAG: dihydrodipicolinate synthase family protein [Clostridia bacterium]|nr:dihydrodipicolinate synthase family protein [Clostridia bacterium]
MNNDQKFAGIYPAFYACYDDNGQVSPSRTEAFVEYLIGKGIDGLYICGSSGECIYQTVSERKLTLEAAMSVARGRVKVIAHVACNGIAESRELARHAQSQGVDAIAAIPPIYFKLPEASVAEYWNSISEAAPDTPFFVYNIPQLAGIELTAPLLKKLLENKNVVGVKNSSPSIMDIIHWRAVAGTEFAVFNGCDEQLIAGLAAGACGGIGGTYGAMPELYVKLYSLVKSGELERAKQLQLDIYKLILGIFDIGNMFPVVKAVVHHRALDIGEARSPLPRISLDNVSAVEALVSRIDRTVEEYCG